MSELQTMAPVQSNGSSGKAWLRALELTAPIARNRDRILSTVIEELAAQLGDTPALLSEPRVHDLSRALPSGSINTPDGRSSRALPKAKSSAC